MLTKSNPGAVSVCPGENLHFICSTNQSFIEWNITILQPESGQKQSRTKLVSDISPLAMIIINGTTFDTARNSSSGSRPLISTLSVANVTSNLNETTVNCTSIGHTTLEAESLITSIHIIRVDTSEL